MTAWAGRAGQVPPRGRARCPVPRLHGKELERRADRPKVQRPIWPIGQLTSDRSPDVSAAESRHDGGMDSTTITQSLEAIFNPIVLASAAIVALAFLTGLVARFIEIVEERGTR